MASPTLRASSFSGHVRSEYNATVGTQINQRVEREGGSTGAVQVSLLWNTLNDLDLHIITPNYNEIYYKNKKADNGELDVDMNVHGHVLSENPVENIVWTAGNAPKGKYQVYVVYYGNNGDSNPDNYWVKVIVNNETKMFNGEVEYVDEREAVCDFNID